MITWLIMCSALITGLVADASAHRGEGAKPEHRTSNIDHRTSNQEAQHRSMLDVRCSMLDVPFPFSGEVILASEDNDEAVRRGGEILGRGWVGRTHPFYDSRTDDVRLIPVQPPPAPTNPSNARWMGYGILAALAILVLLILFFFIRRLRFAPDARQKDAGGDAKRMSDVDRIEALPFRVQAGQGDLLAQATELYRQGRFAEAIVLLYSYFLVEMDKHQVIRLAKGKTNRQYLREIGPRRLLRDLVERTMTVFEAVFFGQHPLDRRGFEVCWAQVAEFHRLVQSEGEQGDVRKSA
jgi:hypothetical protein